MVPSMPGCVSQARTRDEALARVREAMKAWAEVEAEHGRTSLAETADVVLQAVSAAMRIIDHMHLAGELPTAPGYDLELADSRARAAHRRVRTSFWENCTVGGADLRPTMR